MWEATRFVFLPIKLQNSKREVVGEMKSWTKLLYQGIEYNFDFETKPITKAFTTPNKFRVFKNLTEEIATIVDPQWLREIKIVVPNCGAFGMFPKISFSENYDINFNNNKIGEFREQFFAPTPRGHLYLDDTQANNIPLVVSTLYRGLYNKMIL